MMLPWKVYLIMKIMIKICTFKCIQSMFLPFTWRLLLMIYVLPINLQFSWILYLEFFPKSHETYGKVYRHKGIITQNIFLILTLLLPLMEFFWQAMFSKLYCRGQYYIFWNSTETLDPKTRQEEVETSNRILACTHIS